MATKIEIEVDEHADVKEILLNGAKLKHVKTIHLERHNSYIEIVASEADNPVVLLDAGLEVRLIPSKRLQ